MASRWMFQRPASSHQSMGLLKAYLIPLKAPLKLLMRRLGAMLARVHTPASARDGH